MLGSPDSTMFYDTPHIFIANDHTLIPASLLKLVEGEDQVMETVETVWLCLPLHKSHDQTSSSLTFQGRC